MVGADLTAIREGMALRGVLRAVGGAVADNEAIASSLCQTVSSVVVNLLTYVIISQIHQLAINSANLT